MNNEQIPQGEVGQSDYDPMLQFFSYQHLPPHLQAVSEPFSVVANMIVDTLPNNNERQFALRKLVEAKDCAVRAKLYQYGK